MPTVGQKTATQHERHDAHLFPHFARPCYPQGSSACAIRAAIRPCGIRWNLTLRRCGAGCLASSFKQGRSLIIFRPCKAGLRQFFFTAQVSHANAEPFLFLGEKTLHVLTGCGVLRRQQRCCRPILFQACEGMAAHKIARTDQDALSNIF